MKITELRSDLKIFVTKQQKLNFLHTYYKRGWITSAQVIELVKECKLLSDMIVPNHNSLKSNVVQI